MIITSRFVLGHPNPDLRRFDTAVRQNGVKVGEVFDVRINGKEITFSMEIRDDEIDLENPPAATMGVVFRDGEHEVESVGFIAEKSWLHMCSYCGLKRLEREAELNGMKVTVQPSVDDVGYDVYVHPPDIEMPEHIRGGCDGEDLPEIAYWKSWLFSNYLERGCRCDD